MQINPCIELAKNLLAEATNYDAAAIPADASVENWTPWDSLSHMRVILKIEAQIGRELSPESVIGISNLNDIVKILSNHLKPTH